MMTEAVRPPHTHTQRASRVLTGPDVFISYSHENRPVVERLAGELTESGIDTWWDRNLATGERFRDVIDRHLAEARVVIVIWSAHSIRSDWVLGEAGTALERRVLLPVRIDETDPPTEHRQLHVTDLRPWLEDDDRAPLEALLRDVRARLDPDYRPPPLDFDRPRWWQNRRLRRTLVSAGVACIMAGIVLALMLPTHLSEQVCRRYTICLSSVPRVQTVEPVGNGIYVVDVQGALTPGKTTGGRSVVLAAVTPDRGLMLAENPPETGAYVPTEPADEEAAARLGRELAGLPPATLLGLLSTTPDLVRVDGLGASLRDHVTVPETVDTCAKAQGAADGMAVIDRLGGAVDETVRQRIALQAIALSCDLSAFRRARD